MIISGLINLILEIFRLLTAPINIPSMPDGIRDALQTALEYMSTGLAILGSFTHLPYLIILFGIILAVDVGVLVYKIVMWVIKKIPFLGMS